MVKFLPTNMRGSKKLPGFLLMICCFHLLACTVPSGVFEKDIALPGQQWNSSFRPTISFDIGDSDTSSRYNIYLVLRHTDAYNYNNIWIRGTVRQPGDTALRSERYDLQLATNEKGWLGSGMDDIYEHRVEIQQDTRFTHPGTYSFTLEQVMREDPLKHILNVGVRIEKVP
jgi:gliding motility-associated lipoprotein GldH